MLSRAAANTACSGRVGVCGFFKHFPHFEFFLLPSIVHARPHAGIPKERGQDTNRWAATP